MHSLKQFPQSYTPQGRQWPQRLVTDIVAGSFCIGGPVNEMPVSEISDNVILRRA